MSNFADNTNSSQYNRYVRPIHAAVGALDFANTYNLTLDPNSLTVLEAIVSGNYDAAEILIAGRLLVEISLFNWLAPNSSIQNQIENFVEYLNKKNIV